MTATLLRPFSAFSCAAAFFTSFKSSSPNNSFASSLLLLFLCVLTCDQSVCALRVNYNRASPSDLVESVDPEQPPEPVRCPKYCACTKTEPRRCPRGVPMVLDGCGCCPVCARQKGERCDARLPCDKKDQLYCHYMGENSFAGFCRKRFARSCRFNGRTYTDSMLFDPDCRYRCRCQDGVVTCLDRCRHERQAPSNVTCPNSRLVKTEDRCCARWVCNANRHSSMTPMLGKRVIPQSSQGRRIDVNCTGARRYTTSWSKCSKTCGVGISYRHSTDNVECRERKQTRLCEIRPCKMDDSRLSGSKCTSTVRAATPMRLTYSELRPSGDGYQECRSLRQYRPKFCSLCRREQCCQPTLEKVKLVEFECEDGQRAIRQWLWIKRCRCQRECHLL